MKDELVGIIGAKAVAVAIVGAMLGISIPPPLLLAEGCKEAASIGPKFDCAYLEEA